MPGGKIAIVSIMVVALIAVSYLYFMFGPGLISSFGESRPILGEGEPVEPVHINWIVKKLGTDKLKINPRTGESPEIEMVVNPGGNTFTVTLEGGLPDTRSGPAADPDIRLTGDRSVIAGLLVAPDILSEVKRLAGSGEIEMEMLRTRSELDAMGYGSLYDELSQ